MLWISQNDTSSSNNKTERVLMMKAAMIVDGLTGRVFVRDGERIADAVAPPTAFTVVKAS